ncbi:dihydrofolate reductase family protein [Rhodanobacter sp. Col0626]|uniref:dihydrofolate reductase family protein n=1 Tax=Rhodanobacter sp. Col0626 TaxID=3415679 RepID=UPI003CFB073D
MRELILKMSMSLDGFVAGPKGEAEWVFGADEEAKAWAVEKVWNASLHIMGSRSFQAMAPYWPTSTMAFAPPMNQIPKAVFSRQGPAILKVAAPTGELQPGAESWAQAHVASGDLVQEITRLKAGDGKPILAHGGASFARSLIAQNLVDEYVLTVHPIALGQGMAIFSDLPAPRPLKLVSSRTFPGGVVALIYRPA